MAKRHMKRCSTSLMITEMGIKTTKLQWDITSHQPEWVSSKKNPETINAGEGVERRTLLHCWWECKLIQPLQRTVGRFLKKAKTVLPQDPAIPLLGICPCLCVRTQSLQLRRTLCDPVDCNPPGSSVSRREYWSVLPCLSPGDLPDPGIKPESVSRIGRRVLYH